MGLNLKHLLNPFDKRNPLRPDNVAKDPLGLSATDLLSDPKKKKKKKGSASASGVTIDSTTGQMSVWGVPITANPSDYPAHWYTNWQATQAQTKMTFPEWVANVLSSAPHMAEEVTAWRKETGDVSLEQALMDKTMSDYVEPALAKDKENQEKFKKLLDSWQPTMDANRKLVGELSTEDGDTGHSVLATQELANLQEAIDTANTSAADRETAKIGDIDTSLQEYLGAIGDQQTAKRSNVDAALEKYLGAIGDQRTAKNGELDTALTDYLASIDKREASKLTDIDPLLQSRLDAAETQASATSLGEQAVRDQITAALAAQGYIGGSSFADGQNARATIDARTAAAQALGAAKIANATDVLAVNNEATNSIYDTESGITTQRLAVGNAAADSIHGARTTAADQTMAVDNTAADSIYKAITDASAGRLGVKNEASDALYDAANWGAGQKLSYLDADTKRRLSNLETPIDLASQEVNLNTAIDNAGWAGLNRSLAALDWWKLGNASGGGTTTAAPTTTDTTTSAAGAIGPSLVNAGLSIAQSKNWWQKKPSYDTGNGDNQYTS